MTSDRSYRPRFTLFKALEEIEKCKGAQFDPKLADLFIEAIHENKEQIEKDLEITPLSRTDD